MLILPSVGSKVVGIMLNKAATKAKISFSDGSTAIVCTTEPETKSKKCPVAESKVSVSKKIKKKSIMETKKPLVSIKQVHTNKGMINVPEIRDKALFEDKRVAAIERAKRKAAILEEENMSASERMGINAQEGEIIS